MRPPENATYAVVRALVDELVRSGVGHLCLCPGSRSTPVALEAARHPALRVWVHLDERSCGYFAVGLAKTSRAPVALLSTSGTAAANFLPAVVEARYSGTPLVVLTADRPHELRDCGANQTIDQLHLYGRFAKWFVELPIPEATDTALRYARSVACRAVAEATAPPPGPVHLNLPLREPLEPVPAPLSTQDPALRARDGEPYTTRWHPQLVPDADRLAELARWLVRHPRGIIVCGPQDDPRAPSSVARLAACLGYPVLADPLSQVRCGPHDRSLVVDAYDAFLRWEDLWRRIRPEVVLRFGAPPTSKVLLAYLNACPEARQVYVGPVGPLDPGRVVSDHVAVDPVAFCAALAEACADVAREAEWCRTWQALNRTAQEAIEHALGAIEEPFEAALIRELVLQLPDDALVYVGNSMPVRDLDGFCPSLPRRIRFLGNRGASGIDGVVSSALGAAAVHPGPVVLVLGDLSFYHDLNGLLGAKRYRLDLLVVLVHNDGGGIFSFLPQVQYEHFEELFGTPHGLEFRPAVEMYDGTHIPVQDRPSFREGLRSALAQPGLRVLEVRTDRTRNVQLHRQVWEAVRAAVQDRMGIRMNLSGG